MPDTFCRLVHNLLKERCWSMIETEWVMPGCAFGILDDVCCSLHISHGDWLTSAVSDDVMPSLGEDCSLQTSVLQVTKASDKQIVLLRSTRVQKALCDHDGPCRQHSPVVQEALIYDSPMPWINRAAQPLMGHVMHGQDDSVGSCRAAMQRAKDIYNATIEAWTCICPWQMSRLGERVPSQHVWCL